MVAGVILPHFDLPFRFAPNKHATVVQQDTEEDVTNCVSACLRTRRGTRYYVNLFGIDDPTFQNEPIDIAHIENQVTENEPRAHMILNQKADAVKDLVQIQVGVDLNG